MLLAALAFNWGQRTVAVVNSFTAAKHHLIGLPRSQGGLLLVFMVAYAAELIAFASVYGIWDRYLYPLVPAAAILLLRGRPHTSRFGRSLAFSHAGFVWLAASAFVVAANSFAYDAARWREGQAAAGLGYDARTIDAGYEWVGFHAVGDGRQGDGDRGQAWFEELMWPNPVCAVLLNSLADDGEPLLDESAVPLDEGDAKLLRINRSAYRKYLFFGPAQPLYLYGLVSDRCPPLPAATPSGQGTLGDVSNVRSGRYTPSIVPSSTALHAHTP
jgi:hypothetical protein